MHGGTTFTERLALFAFARRRSGASALLGGLSEPQRHRAEALLTELGALDSSLRHARLAKALGPRADAGADAELRGLLDAASEPLQEALATELWRTHRRLPRSSQSMANDATGRANSAGPRAVARALLRGALR